MGVVWEPVHHLGSDAGKAHGLSTYTLEDGKGGPSSKNLWKWIGGLPPPKQNWKVVFQNVPGESASMLEGRIV